MQRMTVASELSPSAERSTPKYYVIGLSMAVPALLFGLFLGASWVAVFAIAQGRVDFRQLYTAGYMVRTHHGHELYDYDAQKHFQDLTVSPAQLALPFVRPAYQALLFAPLSLLPFRVAYAAWFILNVLMLYLWLRMTTPCLHELVTVWKFLPLAMIMGFLPIDLALLQGQDSIVLLVILSASMLLMKRGKQVSSGAVLGLGLFKFQLVLPVFFLMLVWRRWRLCAGFVISAIALAVISVWLTGTSQAIVYFNSLLSFGSGVVKKTGLRFPIPIDFMANLHGLLVSTLGHQMSGFAVATLILLSSVAFLIWMWIRHQNTWSIPDEFGIAIAASTLVSYYLFFHDMTVLLIPIALMLNRTVLLETSGSAIDRFLLRGSAVLFASPVLILVSPGNFYLISLCTLVFTIVAVEWLRANDRKRSVELS